MRILVTEVLGTVRRYYVAGPTCCFRCLCSHMPRARPGYRVRLGGPFKAAPGLSGKGWRHSSLRPQRGGSLFWFYPVRTMVTSASQINERWARLEDSDFDQKRMNVPTKASPWETPLPLTRSRHP